MTHAAPQPAHARPPARLWVVPAALLLILLGLMALWWHSLAQPPSIVVPMPRMPVPNAQDTFVAAAAAEVNPKAVDQALGLSQFGAPAVTFAQQRQLVAANAQAIALLRKGLTQEYWAPPARSFSALMPYYAGFRSLARLLALKQQVQQKEGDWNGALQTGTDTIQMGLQIPHGATLIGSLVGIAVESIGRQPMWADVDHLTGARALAATRRLQAILANRFPYASTIQEEQWTGTAGLEEVFRSHNPMGAIAQITGMNQSTPFGGVIGRIRFEAAGGPRGVLDHYVRYMAALRAQAALRYGLHAPAPPAPNDPFVRIVAPVFSHAQFKDVITRTDDELLLVGLALRAYDADHGGYPATLASLVPRYLNAVPQDEFAKAGTLRYKLQGKRYALYSVGPDGVDDGGRPATNTNPAPGWAGSKAQLQRWTHLVQPESLGDVVAGVNE